MRRILLVFWILVEGLSAPCWAQEGQVAVGASPTSWRSYNTQSKLAMGEDGVITGWRSARPGVPYTLIYLQKINRQGEFLWESDGVPVCPFPANQDNFDLVADGYGGVIVCWEDSRRGAENSDIYVQRINFRGEALWGREGMALCTAPGRQRKPKIVEDKKHGFYVVWEDSRESLEEVDLYAQHLNLAGRMAYSKEGLPIVTAKGIQRGFRIETDERQFLYVMWEDFRNGRYWNLFSQKLDIQGNFFWPANGLDIFSGVEENHTHADIAPDGYGGLLFVYQKWSDATNGFDIYRGRISGTGENVYHLSTCHASDNQEHPRIVKRGSYAVVAWQDRRYGNWDVFAQMFKIRDGYISWKMNGQPVTIDPSDDESPELITSVSYNSQIFVWSRKGQGSVSLVTQKLDNQGTRLWEDEGHLVAPPYGKPIQHQAIVDEKGGFWCSWTEQGVSDGAPIRVQLMNGNGLPLLNPDGKSLGQQHDKQIAEIRWPTALVNRSGEIFIAWQDSRNGSGNADIYIQKLGPDYKAIWRYGGIPVVTAKGEQSLPVLVDDGVGGVIVIWVDARKGDNDIFAQRIDGDGKKLWNPDGTIVCMADRGQGQIRAISDGKEGVVICWSDARSLKETGFDLYIQRLSHEGEALWGFNGKPFAAGLGLQTAPNLAPDDKGGAYVVWADSRNGAANIFRQHFDSYGLPTWPIGNEALIAQEQNQRNPELVREGEHIYVGWEDARYGDNQEKIFLQRLDGRGNRLWRYTGISASYFPGRQVKVKLAPDAEGNLWAAWLSNPRLQGGASLLNVQCFDPNGNALIPGGQHEIAGGLSESMNFNLLPLDGGAFICWMDAGDSGSRVMIQRLAQSGAKKYPYGGKAIGFTTNVWQHPLLVQTPNGEIVVIWEKGGEIVFSKEKK